MKVKVKEKLIDVLKTYKYFFILTIVICILLGGIDYSESTTCNVYYNNQKLELNHSVYVNESKFYMHVEDITSKFKDYVFYDKISAKLIITSDSGVKRISKTSDSAYIKDNDIYFNVIDVAKTFNEEVIQSGESIYISNADIIEGKVLKNRVELYDIASKRVATYLDKESKIFVQLQDDENPNKIFVVAEDKYYGWVLKSNIEYETKTKEDINITAKKVIVKCENEVESTTNIETADILAINMLRLYGIDKVAKLTHELPKNTNAQKIYAVVNNGQKSANYDQDIITGMLTSAANREKVISQTLNFAKKNNLGGVVIDFANFANTYSELFTQFVKELAAVMHKNNKEIIVNVPSLKYIDVLSISKNADYIILQAYGQRTIASKTSGATASLSYVSEWIDEVINMGVDPGKIILEINTQSILWTERKGTVINAELYPMDTVKEYIKMNNITTAIDKLTGQNYFSYTKGITTYKMWLEDSYSIQNKLELINANELAGISIYKSGTENKDIYNVIKEKLK